MTTELTTITARGQKQIDKYFKAVDKAKASAWEIAKIVNNTVNSEHFSDDFQSLSVYADAIGLSKASVSMQVRAYSLYNEYAALANFTYTAVAALLPLSSNGYDIEDFLDSQEIDDHTSVADIKQAVKEALTALPSPDDEEKSEEEEETGVVESGEEVEETEELTAYEVESDKNYLIINGQVIELTADDVERIQEVIDL